MPYLCVPHTRQIWRTSCKTRWPEKSWKECKKKTDWRQISQKSEWTWSFLQKLELLPRIDKVWDLNNFFDSSCFRNWKIRITRSIFQYWVQSIEISLKLSGKLPMTMRNLLPPSFNLYSQSSKRKARLNNFSPDGVQNFENNSWSRWKIACSLERCSLSSH